MILVLLRHAPTAWNAAGRMQGRADPPLSAAGRAAVEGCRLPAALDGARWMASPARRARETAALLGARDVAIVDALVEMDWGAWEGKTLAALGRDPDFAANEARGLDFQPPGGESPRAVMHRLDQWLATLADGAPIVAVTHKGVMRAALARATCWTMLGKPPVRFDWSRLQRFDWRDGRLSLAEPNLALA